MSSLKEVNHLRQTYRNDLPLFNILSSTKRKRKLTGVSEVPIAKGVSTEHITPGPLDNVLWECIVVVYMYTTLFTNISTHECTLGHQNLVSYTYLVGCL